MKRLRILSDVEGWAYHHRALALQKYAPGDFEVSVAPPLHPHGIPAAVGDTPPDLMLVLPSRLFALVEEEIRRRDWTCQLIGGWNNGWPRRIPLFYDVYRRAAAVFINNVTAWDRLGRLRNTYLLENGVDREIFHIRIPPRLRRPKVLWVGSELGRRGKGYDRFALPIQAHLQARGIECELLLVDSYGTNKRSRDEMAAWYNSGTVLFCCSDTEGTPNPALEAAACGCTVVSTPVGNMPELIRDGINGRIVPRDVASLCSAIEWACDHYLPLSATMQAAIEPFDWRQRSSAFFAALRRVREGTPNTPAPLVDLSPSVTVFVTTVGAPSFDACMQHLEQQDCRFRLEVIDHVAPMHQAFQLMLDRCRTPYYVQVDEDMLLYSNAVRVLYEAIRTAAASTALAFGPLHDAHLGRSIHGVKIFRHSIVRRFPFRDTLSFEKEQIRRLLAGGFTLLKVPSTGDPTQMPVLGLHGTHYTPQSIYERYSTLERKRSESPDDLHWFAPYRSIFLERFAEDPSELNFYALMGVLSAAAGNGKCGDKDYRRYDALPGFQEAQRFFERCGHQLALQRGDLTSASEQ